MDVRTAKLTRPTEVGFLNLVPRAGMCPSRWRRSDHASPQCGSAPFAATAANVQAHAPGMCLVEPECRFDSGSRYQIKTAHKSGPFLFGIWSRMRIGTPGRLSTCRGHVLGRLQPKLQTVLSRTAAKHARIASSETGTFRRGQRNLVVFCRGDLAGTDASGREHPYRLPHTVTRYILPG